MTSTDEYSAQHQAVDDAVAEEEMFEGRPFEIRAATTGLFAELRADKPGFLSALFLVGVLIAGFGAPLLAPYGPVEGNPSTSNIPPVWDGGADPAAPGHPGPRGPCWTNAVFQSRHGTRPRRGRRALRADRPLTVAVPRGADGVGSPGERRVPGSRPR